MRKKVLFLYRKKIKTNKVMDTYVVAMYFFSELNYSGNCSKYYLKNLNGKRISYAGIAVAKHYLNKSNAERAVAKLKKAFPSAKFEIEQRTLAQRLSDTKK